MKSPHHTCRDFACMKKYSHFLRGRSSGMFSPTFQSAEGMWIPSSHENQRGLENAAFNVIEL